MKRACAPSCLATEMDQVRRFMITDARAPTGAEIAFANRTASILGAAATTTILSSKTARDVEMGDDALMLYNERSASRASAPDSWHQKTRALTETELTADPDWSGSVEGIADMAARMGAPRMRSKESQAPQIRALHSMVGARQDEGRNKGTERGNQDAADGLDRQVDEHERFTVATRMPKRTGPTHLFS